jgi:hypothetical protein
MRDNLIETSVAPQHDAIVGKSPGSTRQMEALVLARKKKQTSFTLKSAAINSDLLIIL